MLWSCYNKNTEQHQRQRLKQKKKKKRQLKMTSPSVPCTLVPRHALVAFLSMLRPCYNKNGEHTANDKD
jgi:hypothetical protein